MSATEGISERSAANPGMIPRVRRKPSAFPRGKADRHEGAPLFFSMKETAQATFLRRAAARSSLRRTSQTLISVKMP